MEQVIRMPAVAVVAVLGFAAAVGALCLLC